MEKNLDTPITSISNRASSQGFIQLCERLLPSFSKLEMAFDDDASEWYSGCSLHVRYGVSVLLLAMEELGISLDIISNGTAMEKSIPADGNTPTLSSDVSLALALMPKSLRRDAIKTSARINSRFETRFATSQLDFCLPFDLAARTGGLIIEGQSATFGQGENWRLILPPHDDLAAKDLQELLFEYFEIQLSLLWWSHLCHHTSPDVGAAPW